MPELPEVETVVRELRPHLLGRRLIGVRSGRLVLRTPWMKSWNKQLAGTVIQSVDRRGKWIVIRLDQGPRLVLHLGMTGQLTVRPVAENHDGHVHLRFTLAGECEELRFRDIRRFGSAILIADESALAAFFLKLHLGPEPFELEPAYWEAVLGRTQRCLKAVLLDQRTVAGVGNIYADEALFEASLHPAQIGARTSKDEAERLRRAISRVLRRAISLRGSSIRDYIGGSGLAGSYQKEFRVYGNTGRPCRRCRTAIQRTRLAGRSTHYCPVCQSMPRVRTRGSRNREVTEKA